jgi:drug/metabolite transporter (DMT)-like permease
MAGQNSLMQRPTGTSAAFALSMGAALLWGFSGAIAADAFAEVSPAQAAQARVLVAVVVLVPLALRRRESLAGHRLLLLAFGACLAGVNFLFYEAVDRVGVGPGLTLQFLAPILVLIWMRFGESRPVSQVVWIAAAVAVAGTALVARVWDASAMDPLGVSAGLASAVAFGTYLVLGERLGKRLSAITVMSSGVAVAAVLWLLVLPIWLFPTELSNKVWIELLWLGVLGTAIPFLAEVAALRRAPAGFVGVIATAEPVIGAFAAWWLLNQLLDGPQIVGMLLVVTSVAAMQVRGAAEFEVPFDAAR